MITFGKTITKIVKVDYDYNGTQEKTKCSELYYAIKSNGSLGFQFYNVRDNVWLPGIYKSEKSSKAILSYLNERHRPYKTYISLKTIS